MQEHLKGKRIRAHRLHDTERLRKIGMVNRNPADFDRLLGATIQEVMARGNTLRVKLTRHINLVIAPEYGGKIRFIAPGTAHPEKAHLKLELAGGGLLTVRLTSMGVIHAVPDVELAKDFMIARDFSGKPAPVDPSLTLGRFRKLLAAQHVGLKTVLVGKDAIVVGLSNSAFQDILYRAKLHPKWKASALGAQQTRALYQAMRALIRDRLRLGGKNEFEDLLGRPGRYVPRMGPSCKGQACNRCGRSIQKLAHGGGHVYLCPTCQPPPG
jgi:formamidopyrimidine-DNA glycosylase